jgi:Phage integrase, N-terminal SAM-like domain
MAKRRSRGDGGLYWSPSRQRWRAEVIAGYTMLAERHIIPALGARKLRELRAEDVDRWLTKKAKGAQHPEPSLDSLDPKSQRQTRTGTR